MWHELDREYIPTVTGVDCGSKIELIQGRFGKVAIDIDLSVIRAGSEESAIA